MTLRDRIVERAAQLIADRLLADRGPSSSGSMPDRIPWNGRSGPKLPDEKSKPLVDGDGDLTCPHDAKIFATEAAYKWHRSRVHKERGGGP